MSIWPGKMHDVVGLVDGEKLRCVVKASLWHGAAQRQWGCCKLQSCIVIVMLKISVVVLTGSVL